MTIITISGITTSPVYLFNGYTLIVTATGSINVTSYNFAVDLENSFQLANIDNSGNISNSNNAVAIQIQSRYFGLDTLNNYNVITSTGNNAIINGYYIKILNNFGRITSTGGGAYINNSGVIEVFNNLQSGLTFSGNVPNTYTIIINSLTQYGQLYYSGTRTLLRMRSRWVLW
jgi:hypothetical protein